MNKTNIKVSRRMLEAKQAELLSSPHDIEGVAIERVQDSTDETSLEVERTMAVGSLDRNTALLRQVTEALERIAGGKYGVCLACQETISPKRLAALPWAALCFKCQQATENGPGVDAKAIVGPRLAYSVANHGEQLADSSCRHDCRLRGPLIPSPSTNRGEIKTEAQL